MITIYYGFIILLFIQLTKSNPYIPYNCIKKNGEMGICKEFDQCATAQKMINENPRVSISFTLCGKLEDQKIACCGDVNQFIVPTKMQMYQHNIKIHEKRCQVYIKEKQRMESLRNEIRLADKFRCSNGICQENNKNYIVVNEDFPHMAWIGWEIDGKIVSWKCRGSLISDEFILTSAHCISKHNQEFKTLQPGYVKLGITNQVKITIDHVEDHPKYDSNNNYNDISLVRFTMPIHFSLEIRPACLSFNVIGNRGIGFGKDKDSMYSNLDIYPMEKCENNYQSDNSSLPYGLMDSQFCAGNILLTDDYCKVEAGNPLQLLKNRHLKIYEIIGIASIGMENCNTDLGTIYTKINHYINWIEEKVWPGDVKIIKNIKAKEEKIKNNYFVQG